MKSIIFLSLLVIISTAQFVYLRSFEGLESSGCLLNCSDHGVCKNNTCDCERDWADMDCSYQRKDKITAFVLSWFVGGFAADRFYLGYKWQGALKILLAFSFCFLICGAIVAGGFKSGILGVIVGVLAVLATFGSFAFWLTDVILIGTDQLKDAHGYALGGPWSSVN